LLTPDTTHWGVEKIDIAILAPVPVGHRVEVRWYQEESAGLFSTKTKEFPHAPMVRDLDTGIEYLPDWLVRLSDGKRPGIPLEVADSPHGQCKMVRVLKGKVVRCRIISRIWADFDLQTHLEIEPA